MYRIVENASQEERNFGYMWDLQRHVMTGEFDYWMPFLAFKTREEAELTLKEINNAEGRHV